MSWYLNVTDLLNFKSQNVAKKVIININKTTNTAALDKSLIFLISGFISVVTLSHSISIAVFIISKANNKKYNTDNTIL